MPEHAKHTRRTAVGLHPIAVRNHRYPDPPLVDASCPGLRLVASRTARAWIYRYELNGRMKQTRLGDGNDMSLADARIEWNRLVKLRKSGVDIRRSAVKQAQLQQRGQLSAARYSVKQLISDYEREHLSRLASGPERARTLWVDTAHLATRAAATITRADVQKLVDNIKVRGATRIAVMVLGDLKRAWEHAVERDRAGQNPASMVRAKVKAVSRDRRLSGSELQTLFQLLKDPTKLLRLSTAMRDAMQLELATASRQGEIFGMRYDELETDPPNGIAWWHVPAERMKMRRAHSVHLNSFALHIIARRRRAQSDAGIETPFVFHNPTDSNRPIGPHGVVWAICQARGELTKAGVRQFTMHDLRRTAISIIAGLGYSRPVQNRCAAHRESSIAATYDRHDYTPDAVKAWNDLGGHLASL